LREDFTEEKAAAYGAEHLDLFFRHWASSREGSVFTLMSHVFQKSFSAARTASRPRK
jgi:hypothetical protein